MDACPDTGVLLPNCGCRRCNAAQYATHAPDAVHTCVHGVAGPCVQCHAVPIHGEEWDAGLQGPMAQAFGQSA